AAISAAKEILPKDITLELQSSIRNMATEDWNHTREGSANLCSLRYTRGQCAKRYGLTTLKRARGKATVESGMGARRRSSSVRTLLSKRGRLWRRSWKF